MIDNLNETYHKYECPRCKKLEGVEILYGFPTEEAFELKEQGLISLGGCVIESDHPDPNRECNSCGHSWISAGT